MSEPRMKPWLTATEATAINPDRIRSKRTIRLWVQEGRDPENPTLHIRTKVERGTRLLCAEDVRRVAAFKDAYLDTPTFGRKTA